MAHGQRRQDVIDEMGCGLDHTASVAGGTYATALATERYQEVVATAGAAGASEAVRQNAAAQVGSEVSLDPRGDAVPHGVPLGGLCEEALEVMLDQRIERRLGRTAAPVDGPTVRRRGRVGWV